MKNIIKLISKVIKSIKDYEYAQKSFRSFNCGNGNKRIKIRICYKHFLMLNHLFFIGITDIDELKERLRS